MNFKEQVQQDIDAVFFNLDEFSDLHMIDGVEMTCIIDQNELIEREKKQKDHVDGLHVSTLLVYVRAEEFGSRPKVGSKLRIDNKNYIVTDCTAEMGVYAISLEANRS